MMVMMMILIHVVIIRRRHHLLDEQRFAVIGQSLRTQSLVGQIVSAVKLILLLLHRFIIFAVIIELMSGVVAASSVGVVAAACHFTGFRFRRRVDVERKVKHFSAGRKIVIGVVERELLTEF